MVSLNSSLIGMFVCARVEAVFERERLAFWWNNVWSEESPSTDYVCQAFGERGHAEVVVEQVVCLFHFGVVFRYVNV